MVYCSSFLLFNSLLYCILLTFTLILLVSDVSIFSTVLFLKLNRPIKLYQCNYQTIQTSKYLFRANLFVLMSTMIMNQCLAWILVTSCMSNIFVKSLPLKSKLWLLWEVKMRSKLMHCNAILGSFYLFAVWTISLFKCTMKFLKLKLSFFLKWFTIIFSHDLYEKWQKSRFKSNCTCFSCEGFWFVAW